MKKRGIIFLSVALISNSLPVMAIEEQENKAKHTENSSFLDSETSDTTDSSTINSSEVEEFIQNNKDKSPEELYEEMMRLAENAKSPEEYQKVLEYLLEHTDYASSGPDVGMMNRAARKQGVAEYLGTTKDRLLRELQSHERDNFYLGTPFRGLVLPSEKVLSPNGAPNRYGPGMNCTGFVATAFRRAGGDLGQITRVANAWGDVGNAYNWRDALTRNTEYYEFTSVAQLLASGKAEKGDVLYFEPNYNIRPYDCHIGFFWGSNSKENKMWHSYDRNIMSNIKSATPWTKIMLFKLGSNKNDIISQTNLNEEKFINTNNAYVYSRPYQTGDAKKMTSNGLKNKQVTVTKQVENGHGIWQEFKLNEDGNVITGWLRKEEYDNYINKQNYQDKLILKGNTSYVYSDPYYPGVSTLNILNEKQYSAFSISQKATSGYGEWYYASGNIDGKNVTGWMKSTDFIKQSEAFEVNQSYVVENQNGNVYDSPYTSPMDTNIVTSTADLYQKSLLFNEKVYTAYGQWYKTTLSDGTEGWIKSTDLGFYSDFESIKGMGYINKSYSEIYNEPYRGKETKRIEQVKERENGIFIYTGKATTAYGEWYKGTIIYNGQEVSGWINSSDLMDSMKISKLNETRELTNRKNGVIYDSPYNEGHTKRIGSTSNILETDINLTESVKTHSGLWYKISFKENNQIRDGWIKSTDLSYYTNYSKDNGLMYVNKNDGAVYDEPYRSGITKKIDNLKNMQNVPFTYTEKATTDYGIWYKGYFYRGNQKVEGWVKSTDLDKTYVSSVLNEEKIITNDKGSIYDSPYNEHFTKYIGGTTGLKGTKIKVSQSVQTPRGLWFESEFMINNELRTGWIKSTDLK